MRLILMLSLLAGALVSAQEEVPEVGEVISEQVAGLPAPEKPALPGGVTMAVSTADEDAARHVQWGMTCLHTGWDFQAYRHFCEALKKDPDCLMAHWGVVIALLQGDAGLNDERSAAADRMLTLVDEGAGTELEKRYVFGLTKLLAEGSQEAASVFSSIVENFPNDPQAKVLRSLLGRGGYDDVGDITPDQKRAEDELRELVAERPDEIYITYALLAMRAEAPSLAEDLPLVRKMAAASAGYPPCQHLLGHYEWRSGNHTRAQAAFAKASELYAAWMEKTGLEAVDCAGWVKAECYRAVALASKGDYETALAVAKSVAAIEVPAAKADSSGGRMLLWEARTLPARILMRRAGAGDFELATKTLPPKEEAGGLADKTLVMWSWQATSSLVAGKVAIARGNLDEARAISDNVTQIGESFVQTRQIAAGLGERSPWLRTFKAMEVLASELRGSIAMAGPEADRGSAFNWFTSAVGRQTRATLMMPPAVLTPMEARLGDYYMAEEKWQEAIDALVSGHELWPDDWELLTRLEHCFQKAGMKDQADDVAKRMRALREE